MIQRWQLPRAWIAFSILLIIAQPASAKQTHDARVIKPPVPKYPMLASWLNLEGHCAVRFAVDEAGLPFAIMASCTRPIFCFEAKRSVADTLFEPKRDGGVPVVRGNIVYPLNFAIEGSNYDPETDPTPLELCEELPVS
ncbi:MAG: energy transducer TonB [Henriciella sp.]